MSDPFLIASIALGLSVLASAVRMIDWFLHSDPKVLAKTTRWALIALAVLSVPLLIWLLLKEQWVAATGLLAVMVLLSQVFELSIFSLNLATMLGLGLGIDYSLFVVSRFREEFAQAVVNRDRSREQTARQIEPARRRSARSP